MNILPWDSCVWMTGLVHFLDSKQQNRKDFCLYFHHSGMLMFYMSIPNKDLIKEKKETVAGSSTQDIYLLYILLLLLKVELVQWSGSQPRGRAPRKGHEIKLGGKITKFFYKSLLLFFLSQIIVDLSGARQLK